MKLQRKLQEIIHDDGSGPPMTLTILDEDGNESEMEMALAGPSKQERDLARALLIAAGALEHLSEGKRIALALQGDSVEKTIEEAVLEEIKEIMGTE